MPTSTRRRFGTRTACSTACAGPPSPSRRRRSPTRSHRALGLRVRMPQECGHLYTVGPGRFCSRSGRVRTHLCDESGACPADAVYRQPHYVARSRVCHAGVGVPPRCPGARSAPTGGTGRRCRRGGTGQIRSPGRSVSPVHHPEVSASVHLVRRTGACRAE